jgi:hypothetical protein
VVDAGAAAGAVDEPDPLEADAEEPSLLDEAAESDDEPEDALESLLLSLLDADFLALPYPSANQPPPLKEIAGAETTRSSEPPQCGHSVISGSENF